MGKVNLYKSSAVNMFATVETFDIIFETKSAEFKFFATMKDIMIAFGGLPTPSVFSGSISAVHFDSNFMDIYKLTIIESYDALAPIGRQGIVWTKDGQVSWRVYVTHPWWFDCCNPTGAVDV